MVHEISLGQNQIHLSHCHSTKRLSVGTGVFVSLGREFLSEGFYFLCEIRGKVIC